MFGSSRKKYTYSYANVFSIPLQQMQSDVPGILCFGNIKKLDGAKSGEQNGCETIETMPSKTAYYRKNRSCTINSDSVLSKCSKPPNFNRSLPRRKLIYSTSKLNTEITSFLIKTKKTSKTSTQIKINISHRNR